MTHKVACRCVGVSRKVKFIHHTPSDPGVVRLLRQIGLSKIFGGNVVSTRFEQENKKCGLGLNPGFFRAIAFNLSKWKHRFKLT